MFAAWDRFEEFKFDFPLNLFFAQISCADLNLIPIKRSVHGPFDLGLVNGCPLAEGDVSVNDKKTETGFFQSCSWVKNA